MTGADRLGDPGRSALRRLRTTQRIVPQQAREQNRTLLLQTVFAEGPLSRAELARRSGISAVSVSDLAGELVESGLLVETGTQRHSGAGKPAVLLSVREDAFRIVALHLSDAVRFIGVVTDLRGTVLHRASVPIDGRVGEEAIEALLGLAQQLVDAAEGPVLGIGIGTPGIVVDRRIVRRADVRRWFDLDLAARVTERLGLPAYIENDGNAAALGMYTHDPEGRASLLGILLTYGVGAGLIVGGALVEGDRFAAGEIGHLSVQPDGPLCDCGRRGCLQRLVDTARVRERLAAVPEQERDGVLAEAGAVLGTAIAPMLAVTGVGSVFVSGPDDVVTGTFLGACRDAVRARVQPSGEDELVVEAVHDIEDLVLVGVSALVLEARLGLA
ncbi:ROK family protein [uncultured Microbacterium sp.]|uniref:ROK family protein n=1 Tax=uncultured Microbacterium sp. TaxID=191216 RepID=UPI0025FFCC42|nr:ROK family protein [uncultured Microbacterium sp.]